MTVFEQEKLWIRAGCPSFLGTKSFACPGISPEDSITTLGGSVSFFLPLCAVGRRSVPGTGSCSCLSNYSREFCKWQCRQTYYGPPLLEKSLESPLDYKEIKPVNPKGNQSWIFIGRTDAEAKATVLWPPDVKSWLIEKDPDAGKDWRQKEKKAVEDEMVG